MTYSKREAIEFLRENYSKKLKNEIIFELDMNKFLA